MSMKGIDRTIADLRKHGNVFAWQDVINYGYQGPYFEQDVRRVTLGDIAERVEADVADILAENERLLSALKPVLDAYISQDDPSVDVYDSRLDAAVCVRAVREAKRVYGGGDK